MAEQTTSTEATFEAIRARHAAASRGPWKWFGYLTSREVSLEGKGVTVMDVVRWGMTGAQPRFSVKGILHTLADLSAPDTACGRTRVAAVNHPDARFIAASWQDVRDLLALVDAQRSRLAELRRVGGQFANLSFNVTQRDAPLTLSEREREVLKQLQVEWDVLARATPVPNPVSASTTPEVARG